MGKSIIEYSTINIILKKILGMKKIFKSLFLLFIASTTFAQEEKSTHLGLKVAPSLAWLKSDTKGYESNGSKFGFTYGLIADFNFSPKYAFGTGIDISYRSGKFKTVFFNKDTVISTNSSYTMQYIEIPVTLKLKTNEIGSLTYFIQIGISPGINIRAKKSFKSITQTTVAGVIKSSPSSEDDIENNNEINNFNLSMVIGGGAEYNISGETILIGGLQFNNGFLDAFDGTPKVNTNYLALTLGVLF